jgi:hypothetical protein
MSAIGNQPIREQGAKKSPDRSGLFFPQKRCLPATAAAATGITPVAAAAAAAARTTAAAAGLVLGLVHTKRATTHILTVEVLDRA